MLLLLLIKMSEKNNLGCCGKPLKFNDPRRKKNTIKKIVKKKFN